MLLGIKDNTGFGNNADELKTASILFENIVIKPIQEMLLDGFERILNYNDIRLNLYFKTLQPLEFSNEIETPMDAETREEETGVKLSSQEPSDEQFDEVFAALEEVGEVINEDEWELVDERPVDYDAEQALSKYAFASTGSAFPNAKSSQDGVTDEGRRYKVRYSYAPASAALQKSNSREFCKKMIAAGKVYRKEDIERMGGQAVNAGFGPEGAATYSIWLYKGGARCHHFWMRKTYLAKAEGVTPDVGNPNAEVSVNQARRAGVDLETNPSKVAKRPIDMDDDGFLPK
jgi:hypothetical protein